MMAEQIFPMLKRSPAGSSIHELSLANRRGKRGSAGISPRDYASAQSESRLDDDEAREGEGELRTKQLAESKASLQDSMRRRDDRWRRFGIRGLGKRKGRAHSDSTSAGESR